jgi:hypothetical protein
MMTMDPEWAAQNPEKAQAQLIDMQYQDYVARYQPLEDELIAEYMKSPEESAQQAGLIAGSQFKNVEGMSQRSAARRGAVLTPDQLAAQRRSVGLAEARTVGTAENLTRRHVNERNMNGLSQMMGLGHGLHSGSMSGLSQSSSMAASRNAQHASASQAHKQNTMSTALGMAGLAAAVFI